MANKDGSAAFSSGILTYVSKQKKSRSSLLTVASRTRVIFPGIRYQPEHAENVDPEKKVARLYNMVSHQPVNEFIFSCSLIILPCVD